MKLFRLTNATFVLCAVLVPAILAGGCAFTKRVLAKDKMNQGVLKYNQGRMDEAKSYFKEATDYVPDAAVAWLYYGAVLSKDYKAANGPEKDKLANEALDN